MGGQVADVIQSGRVGEAEFALIGHQENWPQIAEIVRGLRPLGSAELPLDEIRSIVPWIPPRTVSRVRVESYPRQREAAGVYIDTFITPDELASGTLRPLLAKVHAAADVAAREGARIASLGGFTSIVLERALGALRQPLAFTTGNTLTAALLVHGITAAAAKIGITLAEADVVIVGGTGDIGSGCARWLAPRVGRLQLAARHHGRLAADVDRLRVTGHNVTAVTDLNASIGRADVVLAVASMAAPSVDAGIAPSGALLCDAGYPKNLIVAGREPRHIFWGGMGVARGGIRSDDGMLERFYRFPVTNVGHGCMLEALLLALAQRYEPFSTGRGNITPARIDEIWRLAQEHGFALAPFFNGSGLWRATTMPTVAA